MKKIYLKPEIEVVEMNTKVNLLTISGDTATFSFTEAEEMDNGNFD